jgi:2-polyprenyl-3-methyl-5-hydroxy-6-metoxy-1,4-benzoquinol methylase
MSDQQPFSKPDGYWERAGAVSYARAMYCSSDVERHVRHRLWHVAIDIADAIGISREGHVLDYGCGDGAFANDTLARCYRAIDGYDKAKAAIERARANAPGPHVMFVSADLVTLDYGALPHYDGAFLMGILHHIKRATPEVVRSLARVTDKMVVLEPNGNHLVRKVLEFIPSYRRAGEDSFRTRQIMGIFAAAGWSVAVHHRLNLFPNFTPGSFFRLLAPLEPRVEASRFWNALCTVNMFGLTRA